MAKVMQILLLLGSIGSFIFFAACLGGNKWIRDSYSGEFHQGLWRGCVGSRCDYLKGPYASWFKAVRAFAWISVLASIAGIILAIVQLAVEHVRGFIASILLFCAAGCMALALIIFDAEKSSSSLSSHFDYGWTYIIGWVGTLGAITAAIFGFFAEKC